MVFKMFDFTGEKYVTSILSTSLEMSSDVGMVKISSIEETSLMEDVVDLGLREKQLDVTANITAKVTTSRPEDYEMIERHLARVKMKVVDTILKAMEVVGMYERTQLEEQGVLSRTQLDVEAVLGLELQV